MKRIEREDHGWTPDLQVEDIFKVLPNLGNTIENGILTFEDEDLFIDTIPHHNTIVITFHYRTSKLETLGGLINELEPKTSHVIRWCTTFCQLLIAL
jgi:hypothetical protein